MSSEWSVTDTSQDFMNSFANFTFFIFFSDADDAVHDMDGRDMQGGRVRVVSRHCRNCGNYISLFLTNHSRFRFASSC